MNDIVILGVLIIDRQNAANEVQKVLTNYGCFIKTRLGLHELSENECSSKGLVLLELVGDTDGKVKLEQKLRDISGVEVQKMSF